MENLISKLITLLRCNDKIAFLCVGASAAIVHQATVMLLVQNQILNPLKANFLGFACAWLISYLGHYYCTFQASISHVKAIPKFLSVALLGFIGNQLLYAALLRYSTLHYAVALFLVLLVVAFITFMLSKLWAFAASPHV